MNCSNDGGHIGLAQSMYRDKQLSVEKYYKVYVIKPDLAYKDGVIYSDRLPGMAFLIVPFYFYSDVMKSLGLPWLQIENLDIVTAMLLSNAAAAIGVLLLFLICYKGFKMSFITSYIVMLLAGLTTGIILESSHLFSHAVSLCLLMAAVYLTLQSPKTKNWVSTMILVFVMLGFSVVVELQNVLFALPLLIYSFKVNNLWKVDKSLEVIKLSFLFGTIISVFLGVLLVYNHAAFGEYFLKSNKYNPFFPEEQGFMSSLSGNPDRKSVV